MFHYWEMPLQLQCGCDRLVRILPAFNNINLLTAQNEKVTVGRCVTVTDNSGTSTHGLTADVREMSTPPTLQLKYGHFIFFDSQLRPFQSRSEYRFFDNPTSFE